ncbi:hypothetical protein ATCC90586_004716 [Pythium insidiosum]|nr:hypothetical protein ATCC90586_004716 [Pythium insidiosum]
MAQWLGPMLLVLSALSYYPSAVASAAPYQYVFNVESRLDPLVYLAEFAVGPGGSFDIALDVTLIVDSVNADRGRTMLHFLVCDTDAVAQFSRFPSTGIGSPVSHEVPSVCAMANRTLDEMCTSYPLTDDAQDNFLYRSQRIISGKWQSTDGRSRNRDGMLYFYIDACETVGGSEGVLRSCLRRRNSVTDDRECFFCPRNNPMQQAGSCVVPTAIRPALNMQVKMTVCDQHGSCLAPRPSFLATFFLVLAIVWGVLWLIWASHIRASREAAVDLQVKMKLVPMALCAYAVSACVMQYTANNLTGSTRNLVVNLATLCQMISLAVPAEMIVLLAKGWKITRTQLEFRELQYVRWVTAAWAISYVALKNSVTKHLTIFLIWGVSWGAVVFMIWYNSAFNLNMLMYQVAMVRQLRLDTARTPVYTKYLLFRRFRALLALYVFFSCILGVLGLVGDATNTTWRLTAIAAEDVLNLLLYVSLGYTFRCRRFSNLIQAPAPPTADEAAVATRSPPPSSLAAVAPVSTPLPRIEEMKSMRSMVVVVNPNPNERSLGVSFGNDTAKAAAKATPNGPSSPQT